MDPLTLAVLVLVWLASVALAAWLSYRIAFAKGHDAGYLEGTITAPMSFKEELQDLRYIKEQLDNPPQHHEHVWSRKPDMAKMGWKRYRCEYKGCYALDWRADKVTA